MIAIEGWSRRRQRRTLRRARIALTIGLIVIGAALVIW